MLHLLYESCGWHTRVALFDEDYRLQTIHYDDELRQFLEGTTVLGRVRKVSAGLNAAFVDIGDSLDGFLPLHTLPKDHPKLTEGAEVMVRVTRAPVDGKGAKLDGRVLTRKKGDAVAPAIILPHPNALSRTLMDAGDSPVRVWVVDERTRQEVGQLISADRIGLVSENEDVDLLDTLDDQLANAAGPQYSVEGGASLTIEVTKALTSVDVDAGRGAEHMSHMDINKASVKEIFRLSRLLELGGSIVIDFISPRNKTERDALMDTIREVFAMDMVDHEIMPISRSGLVEIVRKKVGENLMIRLRWPIYVAGNILLSLWRKQSHKKPIVIEAHPDVANLLQSRLGREKALAYLGVMVDIRAEDTLPVDKYRMFESAR